MPPASAQRELARRIGGAPVGDRPDRGRQADAPIGHARQASEACGFELRLAPERGGGVDRSHIRRVARHDAARSGAVGRRGTAGIDRPVPEGRPVEPASIVTTLFDPARALRVLNRHRGPTIVLIGGLAGDLLGAPSGPTTSTSVTPDAREHASGSHAALNELARQAAESRGSTRTFPSSSTDAPSPPATPSPSKPTPVTSTCSARRPAPAGFRDLDAGATAYDLGDGLVVRIVALDDLIRMKEAAGRPKDESHLHVLAALKRIE